jgi:hypothetical protein
VAVIVKRAQIDSVKAALASVASNGQALAAADAAVRAAKSLASHLRSEGGPIRDGAAKDLDEYGKRVEVLRKSLDGNPSGGVGETWVKAKEQIFNLYMLAFTVESTMPEDANLGDGWGAALSSAVADLPKTIGEAVRVAAKVATTIVTETAKIGGSVVWGFVRGAWPLLLVAGVGLAVVIFVKGKALKAVVP